MSAVSDFERAECWDTNIETAFIQLVRAQGRRHASRRRERTVCRIRISLHIYHVLWLHRLAYHPGDRSLVWWSRSPQVSLDATIPEFDGGRCHNISVDVLGIQSCLFQDCRTLHRRSRELRNEERHGCSFTRKRGASRNRVLLIPASVLVSSMPGRQIWED